MARAPERDRWTDHELLAAIGDRDGAAFETFYRRHRPLVLAFLMRETADREVAADLAAEVFAAVILSAHRYRPERDGAAPWVLAIARNKLADSRRRGAVEARARRRLGLQPVALNDDDLERVEQVAAAGSGALSRLVDQLPEPERDAVRSRIIEEKSYAEIAEDLSCSELVIRKRVSRGLARVRARLEES